MSYSFSVRASSKSQAKMEVAIKMAETVGHQKCHARDLVPAVATANAFIETLADDETKDVAVTMSGSLTGTWSGSDVTRVSGANVSVSAYLADRAPAA